MRIRMTKKEFGSTRKNKADSLNEQQSCSQVYTDHHHEEFLQSEKGIVIYQMSLLGFSL